MTYLKSSNSNDKIKYAIKEDSVLFAVDVFEDEKHIKKLIKYLLLQLKENNCTLPIKFEVNDYIQIEDINIEVEEITNKNFRFSITVAQDDFLKFFRRNVKKILKNKYDNELDYNGYIEHNWY